VTTGSTGYPKWGLSFTYDRYGNRTAQTVTAGTAPSSSLSIAAATNRITGYTYDANGNLTVEPFVPSNNNYTYDGENRLVTFASGSASATYSYDGNGLRVKKVSGSTTTVYVFSGSKVIAEYANGSLSKEYVYSGSQLLATIAGTTTTYHHPDHLSVRQNTNASGSGVGRQGHFPFGESWYSVNTTTKWQFTSFERDTESGNDYAMARYHMNRVGRFSSPDLLAGLIGDPQSLNRYAYVANDPLNGVDPLGLLDEPTCKTSVAVGCGGMDNGGQGVWAGAGGYGGAVGGGAGVEACGVDPYCIHAGGIGPFGSPMAQLICARGSCRVGSWADARVTPQGVYINASVQTDYYTKEGEYITSLISQYINLVQFSAPQSYSGGDAANNGSFWGYLASKPWVVSWILPVVGPVPGVVGVGPAGGVAWNPQTHNLCVGAGLGASAGHNAAIGPLLTSSGNVDRILRWVVGFWRGQLAFSFASSWSWMASDRQFLWSRPRADYWRRGPFRSGNVVRMCKALVMVSYGTRDYR